MTGQSRLRQSFIPDKERELWRSFHGSPHPPVGKAQRCSFRMGLGLMIEGAQLPPFLSLEFWDRFGTASDGNSFPDFLAQHHDEHRPKYFINHLLAKVAL